MQHRDETIIHKVISEINIGCEMLGASSLDEVRDDEKLKRAVRKTAIIVIPVMLITLFTSCGRAVGRIETEKSGTSAESVVQEEAEDETEVNEIGEDETRENEIVEYSNPIDAYFLPRIENASCEAERRQMQDTYRGVWKTEFENIMAWMKDKCVYQEDKDTLLLYEESVESLIETTQTILVTNYEFPPGSDERKSWGNSVRSELNQEEAEIYRDAGMRLINDSYIFMERDYSLELYE